MRLAQQVHLQFREFQWLAGVSVFIGIAVLWIETPVHSDHIINNLQRALLTFNGSEAPQGQAPQKSIELMIYTLLSAITFYASIKLRPTQLVINLILSIVTLFITTTLLLKMGLLIQFSKVLIPIGLSFYIYFPYSLFSIYRTRAIEAENKKLTLEVEELKRNFLSLVTHDLRTPVAKIMGLSELILRDQRRQVAPEHADKLYSIIKTAEELNGFISRLLELTKIDSNHFEMNIRSTDINQLIEKTVENMSPLAQSKRISIQLDLEPLFPISCDPELIQKVISNLIDNGLKYTPELGVLKIQTRETDHLLISIKDNGPGMSAADLKTVFNRFTRLNNDHTVKTMGTGLGLYLSKFFVESHGGTLTAVSSLNEGSEFKINLPTHLVPTSKENII